MMSASDIERQLIAIVERTEPAPPTGQERPCQRTLELNQRKQDINELAKLVLDLARALRGSGSDIRRT